MNPPTSRPSRAGVRFAAAIFLSSSLLFLIEPVAGKRLVPLLGGSAAVWTACLVFFQCALLLGYFTAHWLVTRLGPRRQFVGYVALVAASLLQLWCSIDPSLSADAAHPIVSVLWLLTILIGLPFVTLSATSPLLQAWYARVLHQEVATGATLSGVHAYRLFAVSNVGSLLALVIYPWLIEPRFSLHDQGVWLTSGFAVLALACAAIGFSMRDVPMLTAASPPAEPATPVSPKSGARDRVLWVSLAACGSVLLSAVTNHLSQNVATIPLLWVIPLVVYLLTFVIAFSGTRSGRWWPRWFILSLGVVGMGGAGYLLYHGDLYIPMGRVIAIFTGSLFSVCLLCHSELYRLRPSAERLTHFYFFVAAGGALGAILVGIVAPTVLTGNYELAIGLCLAAGLALAVTWQSGWLVRLFWAAAFGVLNYVVVTQVKVDRTNSIVRERNFYGVLHVTQVQDSSRNATVRTLYHGVIEHGQQVFRQDLYRLPTTYYGHRSGVGFAMDLCCGNRPRRVGVIGLGTGTMAAYGMLGDTIRFYDINPAVEPIARYSFTYLRNSGAHIDVVDGDARVSMAAEPPQRYDVIVVDAFSGDAIPVHLINIEALQLYRRHLATGGIVAFHTSNRYLMLPPVVQQLADHAGMKAAFISSGDDSAHDVFSSDWVLVTSNEAFLSNSEVASARDTIAIPRGLRLWTDDYNSLLPVLRFLHESP